MGATPCRRAVSIERLRTLMGIPETVPDDHVARMRESLYAVAEVAVEAAVRRLSGAAANGGRLTGGV